jgi:hypothetical protein
MRAIDDDRLPNAVKTGISKALLSSGEIVDNVLEELVGSVGVRAERMYDFAKKGGYTHGLPSGQFTNPAADAQDAITTVLETIEGATVTLDYMHWGPPNNLHVGWLALVNSHGYNPATNQLGNLTATKGTPVYLDDMVVVVPDTVGTFLETSLQQWGIAARAGFTPERTSLTAATKKMVQPSPVKLEVGGTSEYMLVSYVWLAGGVVQRGTFTIPFAGFNDDLSYFQVRYTVGGVSKYWIYEDGSGTYPALDLVYDRVPEPAGSFFPFAYFRYNKHSEVDDKTTPAYQTTKKLVKYLGIDYDQVGETINSNPDIADVEQALLMFAVPANTENKQEQRYLWEFFNNLFLSQDTVNQDRSSTVAKLATNIVSRFTSIATVSPSIVVQDTRFKMTLRNNGIYRKRVAGSIGPIGSYASGFDVDSNPQPVVDSVTGVASTIPSLIKTHYYRRQVSTGFYDELRVVGMETRFYVLDGWFTIGDEDDTILLIPLDHSITEGFSLPDREELIARSMHFVFNSLVITKIKWYQTGLFKAVLIIIAIIITFLDWGSDGGSVLAAALAAGEYAAAALIILEYIITLVIYRVIFKLFVKLVGVKFAFIVAIVAAVLGITDAFQNGSLQGAPFASELLTAASGISVAIGDQLTDDLQDLLGEFTDFGKWQKEQTKLLDTAKELLDGNLHLSPFVIFGETPDAYYNRTVHSGNIGIVGIDAISAFVDIKLKLPELADTLGIEGE